MLEDFYEVFSSVECPVTFLSLSDEECKGEVRFFIAIKQEKKCTTLSKSDDKGEWNIVFILLCRSRYDDSHQSMSLLDLLVYCRCNVLSKTKLN